METKPWWQSVTVWGGLLSVLTAFGLAGITFDPLTGDFSGNIYTLSASISALAAGVASLFGRFRAHTRIGK